MANEKPKSIPSGGIPSAESLWIPPHHGVEIKKRGGLDKTIYWEVKDVVDFVFPRRYQPKYHQIACEFVELLLERDWVTKKEIGEFLAKNNYSKSTLENKIIPKLARFGLIKREREITGKLGKGRALILSDSLTFTNYLERIAFAWNMLVSTSRKKKNKGESDIPKY
jgi:predicted transcriptional regulator